MSVQNEPNCCQASNPTAMNYPGMSWNRAGLAEFTKNNLYPAFRAAGIDTKVLVHDWNYVAYRNPDGSKALIAHNGGTSAQSIRVDWGNQSFTYTLPARTSATFTWQGTPGNGGSITGLAGKCVDVTGNNSADATRLQIWTCTGGANQKWTLT